MVIHEYFSKTIRRKIGFFEDDPSEEAITHLSTYELCRLSESDLRRPTRLADVAAVVFRQRPDKLYKIKRDLIEHANTFLWHDCRVFVQPAPVKPGSPGRLFRKLIVAAIEQGKLPASGLTNTEANSLYGSEENARMLTPLVHVLGLPNSWDFIATYLQEFPPGEPPFLSLKLHIIDSYPGHASATLPPEETTLVQRAFHDCLKVTLVPTSGGLSGVQAYKAYAIRKDDYVGNQIPYEYFVKIGRRRKISSEFFAYREIALEHIPFHLGPRLRLDRCALGTRHGIIVSDYVSGAENLGDCAPDGRAVPQIASLFNTTLRAWRDSSTREEWPLKEFLRKRMPNKVPEHRWKLIQELGGSRNPLELKSLLDRLPLSAVHIGVVHNDLHALNVLVRGGDAIVIDFEKVLRKAPLLIDYASVEAGLFVSGFVGDGRDEQELLNSLATLYELNALIGHQYSPCDPSDGSAWFFDCVRQVRMQARQIELGSAQYAYILALALAKKACNKTDFSSDTECAQKELTVEKVRALAYVLAERVLVKLFDSDKEY